MCEVVEPPITPAVKFLPPATFTEFNKIPSTYNTHMRDPVTLTDLQHIIRCRTRLKAPGPDLIPNELLQLLPDGMVARIMAVINKALVDGKFPEWWKNVQVTLMTKKAPAERLSNQRPVALCNTIYKLFSIIINSRLTRAVEENAILEFEQEGGRRR
jgi:hypothetical protein